MNWPILGLRDVDPRPDMTVEARAEQAELAGLLNILAEKITVPLTECARCGHLIVTGAENAPTNKAMEVCGNCAFEIERNPS